MKRLYRFVLCTCAIVLLLQAGVSPLHAQENDQVDQKRNRLIGYMISRQLPSLHFSDKVMDDTLAEAAFTLYIKQLDYQKRFLLKKDVEQLTSFALYIDDNLKRGSISLPDAGYTIINERIAQVEKMVGEILASPIDPHTKGTLETDPDKLDYVADLGKLKERWRKILQIQLNNRFLELQEDQKKDKTNKSDEELWKETYEKVAKSNQNFFHRLHQETLQDHYDRFFNAVTRAFDPHTNYIPPADKEQFDISMRGSLEGIGALLREDDGLIRVVRIIPGSASAKQGRLEAEDVILQVAEGPAEPVDVSDMRLREAVRLIRGPKGSEVRLTVRKADGAKEVIPIIRDVVEIEETFVKSQVLDAGDGTRIGYILIPSFYRDFEKNGQDGGRSSSEDTRVELEKLLKQGVKGIILDLRNNGGGALVDAVEITGLFIDNGPVVTVKNSNGAERILRDESYGVDYDGPLVVLVNKFSASASEIVAGALQDYGRAVIIGDEHTHGKGTVQTIIDLNENIPLLQLKKYEDLGALKVMIQKFYRVTGGSTQYKGVEPDIVLPSLFKHIESGERYLEYSLPWDSIASVDYTPYRKHPNIEKLKKKSLARVKNNKAFQMITEESEKAVKRSKDTLVSMDIDDMRAKLEEARKARQHIGAYYKKFREDEGSDEDFEVDTATPEEKKKEWVEEVKEDPYVLEASQVVRDILTP
ncbi:carboxy terminal-processing peptidase [Desulfopila aestuarii]|uniref:C-terminal processing peptidase-1. Serine peptidase. MEROPS family S41A n=1 Tax=Desulfopila aestuarii DSM 18488 TaxID=1121416 RepID=A0A1M7YAZ8_9BACT|nr:carboxy terminal-processing peptidase [Desulfopila aestuarii]SHO49708.1 C-terminal processing peptidase-1. Serine peptidase. MEROPS family S41A [Desulfopila aestuarii DSM 18488]